MPGTASCGGLWGLKFGHTDIVGRPGQNCGGSLQRTGAPCARIGGPQFPFRSQPGIGTYRISGVTRDANGNPLGACVVMLYRTGDDKLVGKVSSDAAGVFSFQVPDTTTTYYAVFYKKGSPSPDVAGTTVNTLTGSVTG